MLVREWVRVRRENLYAGARVRVRSQFNKLGAGAVAGAGAGFRSWVQGVGADLVT